ncbi:hypothetical protein CLV58_1588 [Spirosoma oryzae]|uniref:Uncharacterized protein n=1 Tax=Spirosoma oryzae TaxID=1469603 RepID=A0A2T0RGZ7_9BACT|nr:hypothetical protein [Spirosoma oryzae]PRY20401.1 hypothetical protein CLV58_1588 [Spirosoma oryzae]
MPDIRFFTQADNKAVSAKADKVAKSVPLTGYFSPTGKLVLPTKTVQAMSDLNSVRAIKIGSPAEKRKLTVLYLIPTDEQDAEGFPVTSTPRGLTIELAQILTSGRVDYKTEKYSFTLKPFAYQEGTTGYELSLTAKLAQPKAPYMGKPRGRKPKAK